MTGALNLVVLVSGRGSNLQAILDQRGAWGDEGPDEDPDEGRVQGRDQGNRSRNDGGDRPPLVRVAAVLCNQPQAVALERARAAGVPGVVVDHRSYPSREAFDAALIERIEPYAPGLVVLAGFMRVLSAGFVRRYHGRLVNIHPSLLPDFPGLNTHARAIEAGAREHGATVHFVSEGVDEGPIIIQAAVPVEAGDSPETLAARVLAEEHRILPQAVEWFAQGRLRLHRGRAELDGRQISNPRAPAG